MDSLTHIALGACIGEWMLDRRLGRKAMLWGALAQSVPDIDFLSAFWMDTAHNLLAHRGFTHSFLFAVIAAVFLGLVAERWHRPHNISLRRWVLFFGVEILIHLLLDACNNYGVGWFLPFSQLRVSFNSIYVADPFFSIGPVVACIMLLLLRTDHRHRVRWAKLGMLTALLYFGYTVVNKLTVHQSVEQLAKAQGIPMQRHMTTPVALNNWLWWVVIEDSTGYHTGYRSVFDRPGNMQLQYFPRNDQLLARVDDHPEVQLLKRFSQGYYTAEQRGDTLVFNDLRFGQIIGWMDPGEEFVFHYYLDHPEDNALVVQRGRFAKWDRRALGALVRRIRGVEEEVQGER
jgi:inner membrane protein